MIPAYARANTADGNAKLRSNLSYTVAPRLQPNLGRPFYDFHKPPPPLWRTQNTAITAHPKYVLPSWMPEVWTKNAEAPLDNTRSAMVRDNYDAKGVLADWDKRLRTHIQSFNKDIRGGMGNLVVMPPLTHSH